MRLNCVVRTAAVCVWAVTALGQSPTVGAIDFYGRYGVAEDQLRGALGLREGDRLPSSKGDVEERLAKLPGVVQARLEAVCCVSGGVILYVGIEERGAPHFGYRSPPSESVELPSEIGAEYAAFLTALATAVRAGDTSEDLSQGHSLMYNRDCRAHQERFLEMAGEHLPIIRRTLRQDADEEQRAMAAYLAGYAPDKKTVINDLQYAVRDPDDAVRTNAMRALGAIGVLAARRPDYGLGIQPTWFVEALHSLLWKDRVTAASVLLTLTELRDEETLQRIRERGLAPLTEMAGWKNLTHALPAFIVLGRVAGLPDDEIHQLWSAENRQALFDRLRDGR